MDFSFLKKINWAMFNWLDILFFVILLYFVFKYMKRGLIRSLFSMVLGVLSICLSAWLNPIVSKFVKNNTPIYGILKNSVKIILDSSQNINMQNITGIVKNNVINNAEASIGISRDLLNEILMPDVIKNKFLAANHLEISKILDLNALKDYLSGNLADILLNMICIGLTFILVCIFLSFINKALNLVYYLPFLNLVNKFGGIALGLCWGVIFLWGLCIFISLIIDLPNFYFLKIAFKESKFAIKFYDLNLILHWVANFIPGLKTSK